MKIVYSHKKEFKLSEKKFIINSLNNSFPKNKFFFKKKHIYTKSKTNITEIKKSCTKLVKLITGSNSKKIIFYQNINNKFRKDPIKFLKKKNQIKKISNGIFQFQGEFLKVFRSLNKYFYNLAIKKYKAVDQENPILWPIDLYKKIDYFSDFPQQILMVSGLKRNFKSIKSFSKKYKNKNKFNTVKVDNKFRESDYGLQPAVCDNCY